MNDDLKAYVDGELPPDAAERLRERLDADPALAFQGEEFRRLSAALRALPEPMPVGQAATLEALARRRPLWRGWTVALAGCAAVLVAVSSLPSRAFVGPQVRQASMRIETQVQSSSGTPSGGLLPDREPSLPPNRRAAFERSVRARGGRTEAEGDGLRARYPQSAHEGILREFDLPRTPWQNGGIRLQLGR